jgi:hypothetical protein
MYAISGLAFTGRNGTAYAASVATDFPPADVGLAFQNNWTALNVTQWPGLLDVPEYGVSTQVGSVYQIKLFQTNVPMLIAATGSIGNNGALTLTTALPTGFMNGPTYQWFPAGAIVSASLAGWYYTLMSSTTVGVIYNNTYTSGLPVIPSAAALVPFVTTGPGAYTGSTSAEIALSFPLPGNMMGPNGVLEIGFVAGFNPSTNNKTVTVKAGASTIFSLVEATTGVKSYQGLVQWGNQGQTGAQVYGVNGQPGTSTSAQVYTAIDTTSLQTITVNLTAAVATDWISIDSFSAIVTPG